MPTIIGKLFRNQAYRNAFFLWYIPGTERRIVYYFMPNGACYFNEVWSNDNYKAIAQSQLAKLANTDERKDAIRLAFEHWNEVLEDLVDELDCNSKHWHTVRRLKATIEHNKTIVASFTKPLNQQS